MIVKKAENDFPDEAIEPTLKQLSENLKKGSRSGSEVKIRIRKCFDNLTLDGDFKAHSIYYSFVFWLDC